MGSTRHGDLSRIWANKWDPTVQLSPSTRLLKAGLVQVQAQLLFMKRSGRMGSKVPAFSLCNCICNVLNMDVVSAAARATSWCFRRMAAGSLPQQTWPHQTSGYLSPSKLPSRAIAFASRLTQTLSYNTAEKCVLPTPPLHGSSQALEDQVLAVWKWDLIFPRTSSVEYN